MIRRLSLVLLCFHALAPCIAQTANSGALAGVVSDVSGAVVPNAEIQLLDNSKRSRQSTITDAEGTYRFFFLAPGKYTLHVRHEGFREQRTEVEVALGQPGTRNVRLEIAGGVSTVRVADEMPMLQTENGDVSTTMNSLQISEVPNPGNDLTYIAQTAPGAIMNTDTIGAPYLGNVSILGMPGTSNLFTTNGMNNNNMLVNTNNSGALGMLLGQNEVQEATVVSGGYSGQFGGAAGSSINYLTKSGGNELHGNAAYYWNGRVLNANDWIDNAQGIPRPFDIANQWAGSLGGPIAKDKLFFFFDTEGMHLVLPQPTYVVLPTPAFETATIKNIDKIFGSTSASHKFYKQVFDLYNQTPGASAAQPGNFGDSLGCNGWTDPNDLNDPQAVGVGTPCAKHFFENLYHPANEFIVSGRVDWNASSRDRVFLLVQYDHGQRAAYIDPISPMFYAFTNQPWWQAQLSETHTISPMAANQFLLAGTYMFPLTSVANPAETQAVFPTVLSWCNAGCPFSALGGQNFNFAQPTGAKTVSYQVSDDTVKIVAKHKLGAGISFLRTYITEFGFNFNGTGQILPQTINAFYYGGVAPSNPVQDFTTLDQAYPKVTWNRIDFYSLALYGQDEWQVRPNLTVTAALRAEHQSNPVCATNCFVRLAAPFYLLNHDPNEPYNKAILVNQKQAYANTDSLVWSPRFSFAWQPWGLSRNTVLRGGVGVFYDPVPGILAVAQSQNFPLVNLYTITGYNLAPGEINNLFNVAAKSNAALLKGFASGQTLAQIQQTDPNFSPPIFYNSADRVRTAQYQKWSLQLQQNLGWANSLTIGYFGNHGIHEFYQDVNANAHNFGTYPTTPCSSPPIEPCYDARFGQVQQFGSGAVSNYNGIVVSYEKRISRWGRGLMQVNYTYGHALDEVSNGGFQPFTFGGNSYPQDGRNLRGSYGAAEYDVRHSVNGNYVWEVPMKRMLRGYGPDAVVKGWHVSGTVIARTGFPYTTLDWAETGNLVNDNISGPIYAVPVGPIGPQRPCGKAAAQPVTTQPCLPSQVLANGTPNPGALFIQSECETGFNAGNLPGPNGPCSGQSVSFEQGRNHFRGPGYVTTDLAIMKNTSVPRWENATFTVGLQFLNLFNHPNFGFPDNSLSDATFGQILYQEQPPTSVLGSGLNANVSGRMIQLKVLLQF
jgi:hypothetical protein